MMIGFFNYKVPVDQAPPAVKSGSSASVGGE
jgi:hypothetical protein